MRERLAERREVLDRYEAESEGVDLIGRIRGAHFAP